MRFFGRSLVGLFLLAMTLGFLGLAANALRAAVEARGARGGGGPAATERVFSANLVMAVPVTAAPVMTVFGQVRAQRTLELRSPRAGTVIYLSPELVEGGAVRAGEVLLRLDPADATAARDLARTDMAEADAEAREADAALLLARDDLAAARAQADLRRQALTRQEDIRTRGIGSDAAVEAAALALSAADQAVLSRRQALATAGARVDRAATGRDRMRINLAEAERALTDTALVAAFDGVLGDVSVVRGGILSANERVADLIDPAALEVSALVSTTQYARMVGPDGAILPLQVTVTLDVAGVPITGTGRLIRAAAAVGEGQAGRRVFAALDAAGGFRPGDFVTLAIAEPPLPDAVVLPASALGSDGMVLALGPEDRLQVLPVTLLRRTGDTVVLAAEGVAEREVVRERQPLLGAGIKVRPVRPGAPAAAQAAVPDMVDLTPERRAELVALVEANARMPAEAKARVLAQLAGGRVPAQTIARIEARGGG